MGGDTNFDDLWDHALEKYFKSTGRSSEEKSLMLKLRDPDDLFNQLEVDHQRFMSFRGKHSKLFNAVKQTVRPFMVLASIAQSAISLSPFAPASTVLGALVFLVKAASGVSEAYDWIEQLFTKLVEFTSRLEEYLEGGMNRRLQDKVIDILSCLLEILARAEQLIKDGRWKKYAVAVFLGKDDEIRSSFSKLTNLFDDEQRLVIAISYLTNQRIYEKTEKMDAKLDEMNTAMNQAKLDRHAEQQKAVIDQHLLTTAHKKNKRIYSEYEESALKSSGEWLIAEEQFQSWLNRKTQLLWVSGGPGTGKSFLSSITISKLKATYAQDRLHPNRTSVAYFYIKEHDEELQDLENLLKCLAYQIAEVDVVFHSQAVAVLSRLDAAVTTRKIWEQLFLSFYRDRDLPNAAFIILDGLDEARKRLRELFEMLEAISDPQSRLSFAFFGRLEIAEFFGARLRRHLSTIQVGDKNECDIALYVKEKVVQITVVKETMRLKTKKAAAKLAREIRDNLMAKADGMFFKVVLIMNQLYDKERTVAVFEAIEAAPPQLDAMIARVFERLLADEDVDRDDLNEILLWISSAKVPLKIAELYAVLEMRTGNAYEALEARLEGKFASLFKIDKLYVPIKETRAPVSEPDKIEDDTLDIDDLSLDDGEEEDERISVEDRNTPSEASRNPNGQTQDGLSKDALWRFRHTQVRFAHASIRDFVVKSNCQTSILGISVDLRVAELHILIQCLQSILNYDRNYNGPTLQDYAASYFTSHLYSVDPTSLTDEERSQVVRFLCKLFGREDRTANLIKVTYLNANKTLHYFFEDPSFARHVRKEWLSKAKLEPFTAEDRDWIIKATSSQKDFYRPLANQAAKMWLTKYQDGDLPIHDRYKLYLIWIIWGFLNIDADEPGEKTLDGGAYTSFENPSDEFEKLSRIANSFELDHTSYWHTAYGGMLATSGLYNEAIEQFKEAVELESNSWVALKGLSKCLVQQQNYEEATFCLEEAMKLLPEQAMDHFGLETDRIEIIISKKDWTNAVKYAKETYEKNKNPKSANVYIRSLFGLGEFGKIVALLEDFWNLQKWDSIDILAFDLFEIGCAYWSQGLTSILEPRMNQVLESCDRSGEFLLRPYEAAWIAEFMYDFYSTTDEAMTLCERILSPTFEADLGPELKWAYGYPSTNANSILSKIYYQRAVAAFKADESPNRWVDKLRNLALVKGNDSNGDPIYKMNAASFSLGIYLRKYGKASDSVWKPCFRNSIIEAIDMLGHEDTLSKALAYLNLAIFLLAAGDVKNACAAIAVLLTTSFISQIEEIPKSLEAVGFEGDHYRCDGLCGYGSRTHYKSHFVELHLCTECLVVAFCEDCFPLVKAGKLPRRKCSKEHEFVQVLPVPEEVKGVAAKVDGKTIEVQEDWVSDLRKEWA